MKARCHVQANVFSLASYICEGALVIPSPFLSGIKTQQEVDVI